MNTNAHDTRRIPRREVAQDAYDTALAALPGEVRRYLLYDCPKALDPVTVARSLEAGYTIEHIRAVVARDTKDVYGEEYPV